MSELCPTCGRKFRQKKPKVLTLEQEHQARQKRIRAGINRELRKPMPSKTAYK